MKSIGLLVTGHGEVKAAPVLIRRLLNEVLYVYDVQPPGRPIRKPESSLLKQGDDLLERTATRLSEQHDAVLVLLDLEDDCPAHLGPALQSRVEAACPHKPCAVVCAYRELETWFIFDAENLFGVEPPANPEGKRDAKKWIRREGGLPGYNEVADSPGLCGKLDLMSTRHQTDSFRVFTDRVRTLVAELSDQEVSPYPNV